MGKAWGKMIPTIPLKIFITRALCVLDIYRAMILVAVLIGVFCGISSVFIHKKDEVIIPSEFNNVRVDFYKNRATFICCLVIGITICGMEILMAIALDKIMKENLRKDFSIWFVTSLIMFGVRIGLIFYAMKNEGKLGLHRVGKDMTPKINLITRLAFVSAIYYEIIKGIQFFLALISWIDLKEKKVKNVQSVGLIRR